MRAMSRKTEAVYMLAGYRGGTAFAIVAQQLGYLATAGSWLELAEAHVPEPDAEAFEELLAEDEITFARIT